MPRRPQFANPFAQRNHPVARSLEQAVPLIAQIYEKEQQKQATNKLIEALQATSGVGEGESIPYTTQETQTLLQAAAGTGRDPLQIAQFTSQQNRAFRQERRIDQEIQREQARATAQQQAAKQFYQSARQAENVPPSELMARAMDVFGSPEEARRQVAMVQSDLEKDGKESARLRNFRLDIVQPLEGLDEAQIKAHARKYGLPENKAVNYYQTFWQTKEGDTITKASRLLRNLNWEPRDYFDFTEDLSPDEVDQRNAQSAAGILLRSGEMSPGQVRQYINARYGEDVTQSIDFGQQQKTPNTQTQSQAQPAPPAQQAPADTATTQTSPDTARTRPRNPSTEQTLNRMKKQIITKSKGRISKEYLDEQLAGESPLVQARILQRAMARLNELLQE